MSLFNMKVLYQWHQKKAMSELKKMLKDIIFRNTSEEIFEWAKVYVDFGCEISCVEGKYSYLFHKKDSMDELRNCFKKKNWEDEKCDHGLKDHDVLFIDDTWYESKKEDSDSVSTTSTKDEDLSSFFLITAKKKTT